MILDMMLTGPLDVNCYFIGDAKSREIAIIDPGGNSQEILHHVSKADYKITCIINTHCHFDHVGAVSELVQTLDIDYLIHPEEIFNHQNIVQQAHLFGIIFSELPKPAKFLNHGDRLLIGNVNIDVIWTPGHSPGGICLYCENSNELITGDSLFHESIGRTDLPGGNTEMLLESIHNKLLSLPDETKVFPGHGNTTTIKHEKQFNPFL